MSNLDSLHWKSPSNNNRIIVYSLLEKNFYHCWFCLTCNIQDHRPFYSIRQPGLGHTCPPLSVCKCVLFWYNQDYVDLWSNFVLIINFYYWHIKLWTKLTLEYRIMRATVQVKLWNILPVNEAGTVIPPLLMFTQVCCQWSGGCQWFGMFVIPLGSALSS